MGERIVYLEKIGNYLVRYTVDNECLIDFKFTNLKESVVGNIYRGKVVDKLEALNALFIDIGEKKNAFLQLKKDEINLYNEGDSIIVQLVYPAHDEKGSKVSLDYEISNEYMVLFKDKTIQNISRKIDHAKNKKLMVLFKNTVKDYGFLIRTKAEELSQNRLLEIIEETKEQMKMLVNEINFLPSPKLIYEKPNRLYKNLSGEKIITNDLKTYEILEKNKTVNIIYDIDFSYKYNQLLSKEVKKLGLEKIEVGSGASFTIEKTEAFHVIDVNSASYKNGDKNTSLKEEVNYDLAEEILNQIYFRNLCGIILIDFISFDTKNAESQFLDYFKMLASKHENPLVVLGFTRLGILESRRKKIGEILDYKKVF